MVLVHLERAIELIDVVHLHHTLAVALALLALGGGLLHVGEQLPSGWSTTSSCYARERT
jgi:hypothetical protein